MHGDKATQIARGVTEAKSAEIRMYNALQKAKQDREKADSEKERLRQGGEALLNPVKKPAPMEPVKEAKEKTEYDYEGDMARGQLQSIISNAQRVHDMLEDDTNIAEWVQSKITLAEDYISTVANYMMSELDESKDVGDIPSGDVNSPNLSVKKGKTVASGPVMEASSAAVRMHRALEKIKQSREASERRAKELLNPKKPEPVKEDVMQEREDDEYHTPSKHHVQVQVSKGDGPKTHRKATVRAKEPKHAVSAAIAHYKQQGYTVHDHKYLGEETIQEGRPSQRHPLEGHEYHKKTDAELVHIAKDAHAAAEAMKSHNTTAENKYRDQANDSATVRHFRKTSGMPDWYKKKYGHMKEGIVTEMDKSQTPPGRDGGQGDAFKKEYAAKIITPKKVVKDGQNLLNKILKPKEKIKEAFKPMDEPNYNNSIEARQKKADNAAKRFMDNSVQDRQKKADDAAKRFMQGADKPPFDGPYKKSTGVVTDKSGAKHGGMSIARNLAKQALKKQASKMSVKEGLEESRKAEIVKEIMKKGKKKEDNTFQAEPELGSTVVKADN
jgi:hypothetical protein